MSMPSCPSDDDLLALATGDEFTSAVQAHLETCGDCRQRLERFHAEVSNLRMAVGELLPPRYEAAGEGGPLAPARPPIIGKYVVLSALGRGGQADVYRAVHATLGKEVVIKLARRPFEPGRPERDRLLAEGKVLADLDHPHLARVCDVDFHEGCPFLVMDYVPGRTLHEHALDQRRTPRQAAGLVAQLARALGAAHRRGIVHQDLKPRNILIDEADQPRIIDFGLARLVHAWADPLDQPDGGTAAYMAPEQARGEAEQINPRSDIFALGAVLYFLLTGQAPFRGQDRAEVLDRAKRCDFDRTALRNARVPRRLEGICLRAMALDQADRHARAEELAADLERFVRRPRQQAVLAAIITLMLLAWPIWKGLQAMRPVVVDAPEAVLSRPPREALTVRLFRKNQFRDLKSAAALAAAVPLRGGDELRISVLVPARLHASLYWIDSSGQVTHLADAGPGEVLAYPAGAGEFKQLAGQPGTEAILACWRRSSPIGDDELRQLWGARQPWPALPRETVMEFDENGVETVQRGRPLGPSGFHSDPEATVREKLERLRLQLSRRVDFLAGVAFTHEDPTGAR